MYITIPENILEDKRLTLGEVALLSIYYSYTIYGKEHCCMLTNAKIADDLRLKERQVQNYKQHLKELGLIETNGGVKVWYKGATQYTHNSGGAIQCREGCNPVHPKGAIQCTHNKNNLNINLSNNEDWELKDE